MDKVKVVPQPTLQAVNCTKLSAQQGHMQYNYYQCDRAGARTINGVTTLTS